MIEVNIFKRKNANAGEPEKKELDIKQLVLDELNGKLQGTTYDGCIIMPRGFTIDIQVGRKEEKENVKVLQVIYIIRHDDFDEPMIDPVDSQGTTIEEAVRMSTEIFMGGIWHPLNQSLQKKNPAHLSIDYLNQHYDFDMYAQSVVRIGGKQKQPTMLLNFIRQELPKYIGSKKYYWVRIFLAKMKEREVIEVRINGTVCEGLPKYFKEYLATWADEEGFVCEKQYAILVQREDDQCPFKKELVVSTAKAAIEMLADCKSPDEYKEIIAKLDEMTGDRCLAAEIRIFIPEILAKLTMGYKEGDSLFLMKEEGNIEIRKTQLRSYYYIQQVLLEFLSKQPPKERVMQIVANSVAYRELKKAHEAGHEPKDLYVPGTSFKIAIENYKVW